MISTRRGFLRGLVAAVAAAALPIASRQAPSVSAAPVTSTSASAAPVRRVVPASDWVPLGPSAPIRRIFAPASGALFAATANELLRSDDAGATWSQVSLPGPRREGAAVEVDPVDHRVVYAETDAGLERSDDDGATWTTILPTNRKTLKLAISPADPTTLYLVQGSGAWVDYWLSRSRDRGATWEQLDEGHGSMCGVGVYLFTPHPTDPTRAFKTTGCYAGRNLGDELEESRDYGTTWKPIAAPRGAFPQAIIGGGGIDPARLYLAVDNDHRSGGSTLFTSLDDGATWTPLLEHKGGGTATGSREHSITIGGLAYNPLLPSSVYVGLNSNPYPFKAVDAASVRASNDGGLTWNALGQGQLREIQELALGIDGLNLFAATKTGVMRLSLG
jgi:photosystem II stability/assembly factor-like uncharacterized protein